VDSCLRNVQTRVIGVQAVLVIGVSAHNLCFVSGFLDIHSIQQVLLPAYVSRDAKIAEPWFGLL